MRQGNTLRLRQRLYRSAASAKLAIVLAVVLVALSACASSRGTQAEENPVHVRVQNTVMPPTALTISILPVTGSRRTIGFVAPSETKVLDFGASVPVGPHRLLAEATDGSALASRQFTVDEGDTIEWNVRANMIRVHDTP
jgi:hypothetical protein